MSDATTPANLVARYGSPLYVYDLDLVRTRIRALKAAVTWAPFQPLYAIKANPCPAVAKAILAEGFGIDAVSPGEVALALKLGLSPELVLYTENNMTDAEMRTALSQGVLLNCGSLDRFERVAQAGAKMASIRFNPDVGDGAHEKICTAGPLTKFGVHHSLVDEALAISRRTGCAIVGAHMHIGSGFLDDKAFAEACRVIFSIAKRLPDLRFVDVGGGVGIPYRPDQNPMELQAMGRRLSQAFADFCLQYGRPLELRIEPGRFCVAEAGTLYSAVTSVKTNPDGRTFVGCDTGFNHLIRPAMYGAYHRIDNVSHPDAELIIADVVGNICESGDIFARDRQIPKPVVGDLLALRDTGAYGMAMASTYNTRPLPAEVVLDGGVAKIARVRQTIDELFAVYVW